MWGREGLYGRPVLGCERVAPQVSTGNRTRATIKALPSPLHLPRPYGKDISLAGMESHRQGLLEFGAEKGPGGKIRRFGRC